MKLWLLLLVTLVALVGFGCIGDQSIGVTYRNETGGGITV